MIRFGSAQLWVHDQDAALEFWTKGVGWQVAADVTVPEMGNFRWLAVSPPAQPEVSVVLMPIAGPPIMDAATRDQVGDLVAKGHAGTLVLTTDDCEASYRDLSARGVEFTEAPEVRPYGVDAAFRDPFGNSIRLAQVNPDFR